MNTGYVGIEDDYPISIKQVLDITAELGALETQRRVRELPKYVQPDPDTVSKAQVLETFSDLYFIFDDYKEIQKEFDAVYEKLRELPPSPTPCRPHGHWIRHQRADMGEKLNDCIECSECGTWFSTENLIRRSFCPNCGADMRGGAV